MIELLFYRKAKVSFPRVLCVWSLEYSCFTNTHSLLDGSDLFSREVPLKDAKEYAESIGAIVVETSAKNAINIEELFQGISECHICIFSLT